MSNLKYLILVCLLAMASSTSAQEDVRTAIQAYLNENHQHLKVSTADVSDWEITDITTSRRSGAKHVHIAQRIHGVVLKNGTASFTLDRENKVVHMGNRLVAELAAKTQSGAQPGITPAEAVQFAAQATGMDGHAGTMAEKESGFRFGKGSLAKEDIQANLVYWYVHGERDMIHLVWTVSLLQKDGQHWWNVFVDAHTGKEVDRTDWMVSCQFPDTEHVHGSHCANMERSVAKTVSTPAPAGGTGAYNVFALPIESPSHGGRIIEVNPANATASPFGWHDTDGNVGEEYTITRGNNVHAYEDTGNNDAPGFNPDGGSSLTFDFPYNGAGNPDDYQSAAITNLFYMNNMMHDIWYFYGFDEVSGNFQQNNYGNGGAANDYVVAEAQDGSGTNNANFGTPPDGENPWMQMYLWTGSSLAEYLTVNAPVAIQGSYSSTGASFGPGLPSTPITADVILVEDGSAPVNDGCEPFINGGEVSGKIALIDRGDCNFTVKVEYAQDAGALAVIIVNNVAGQPFQMGGTNSAITIPSIMISMADGNIIKNQLAQGTVNATISDAGLTGSIRDSDFDNGIIAHEYGHGISNRLTGGASNADCLYNDEQMGEGWSDWFGLMLTIEEGDQAEDKRGIGTFSIAQPTNGDGIRPAPYSTDFNINPYTYGDVNDAGNIAQPHGVGFVFATALWDMTWALIDHYGGVPDPDLFNGTGGNNVAMHLVTEALKIQPCNPGMIDGRDAILAADELLYAGQHRCLIWEVFANRGFGFSADQGSSFSRTDQTEAFDLPTTCQQATVPPVADFTASALTSCTPTISFEDNSTDIPQSWAWDFGDGNTSSATNPTHTYTASGTYTVELEVSNTIGSNSTTQQVTINLPASPVIADMAVCAGETANLNATATGTVQWRDGSNNVVHIGNPLVVQNVTSIQTFTLENLEGAPSQNIGPQNTNIGGGGYHTSTYHGAINFTANQELEIVSAWIDAEGSGPRTITVATGSNTDGVPPSINEIVDEVTVNLVNGGQRVYLNLMVPGSGNYNLGANNVSLYRNNSGASYPYTVPGLMSLTSTSANTDPAYYYYFYDIEIREAQCVSVPVSVTVGPMDVDFSFINSNGAVSFTDLTVGANSWLWDFGDGATSTEQNPTHAYSSVGDYTVTLTVNGGNSCSASQVITIDISVGLQDLNDLSSITLHPNPTNNSTTLSIVTQSPTNVSAEVFDLLGKRIQHHAMGEVNGTADAQLDLSGQATGLYFVKVIMGEQTVVRKLVKR